MSTRKHYAAQKAATVEVGKLEISVEKALRARAWQQEQLTRLNVEISTRKGE